MTNPPGSFVWYELITPDPDGAKRFYDAVVGWTVDGQSNYPNGYRMIGRSDGKHAGGVLPLSAEMQEHGARPSWIAYVNVDDVDTAVERIAADGGKALMSPFDIPGIGRVALVADPDGAAFYLMRPGGPDEDSDVFSVDQPQHVRWNELWSGDPAASIDFYTRNFGWRQEGDMDMGEMGKYQFLHHGDTMIGAVMPRMPDVPVSMWNFYIGVDDIDRATDAVRSNGGQVFQEPIEIPGGEYSINTADPQGAMIGFVGPRHK